MDNQPQKNSPQQHNNVAFVLGNSTSRRNIDLRQLNKHGKIYACNAIYREFTPDYLIAVDAKMVKEIVQKGWHLRNQVWTNPNKDVRTIPGLHFFNPHKGWSSGPTALWLASQHGYDAIYIIGFDYEGLNGKVNNIYADTPNYKRSSDQATYFGNWANQTEKILREFTGQRYYRVCQRDVFTPDNVQRVTNNFSHTFFEEFEVKFPGTVFK